MQYFGTALCSQNQTVVYNYAFVRSTVVSAENLDKEMLLKNVGSNKDRHGSLKESNWMKFEFEKEIFIQSIDLYFYENTCLDKCRLYYKIKLDDNTLIDTIRNNEQNIVLNAKSKFLTLTRLDVYPKGAAFITHIEINSPDKPNGNYLGLPKIDISKKTRIKITHDIKGFGERESIVQNKLWHTRSKFFKKTFSKRLKKHEIEQMNAIIDEQDEFRYCDNIEHYLTHDDGDDLVRKLYEDCKCDMRKEYFSRRMKPSAEMMNERVILRGDTIYYNSKKSLAILKNYLEKGDAVAGYAVTHLCLMQERDELPNIEKLRNDKNIYAQYQALKACLYFDKLETAKSIGDQIISSEMASLIKDSFSANGIYAFWVLESLFYFYPDYALDKFLALYKCYTGLYPEGLTMNSYWHDIEMQGTAGVNRILSFQGNDFAILNFIEHNLAKMPELKKSPAGKEFEEIIKKQESNKHDKIDGFSD